MIKLYSKGDDSTSAFIVTTGEIKVNWENFSFTFPGDKIVIGTIEYFLSSSLDRKLLRLFDLSLSQNGKYETISFSQVNEMMNHDKFGYNTNIFLARLIEFFTTELIKKSKKPLGFLGRYQRQATGFSKMVDLLLEYSINQNLPDLEKLIRSKRLLEVYKDGSLHSHFQPIDAISSPAKDRSKYIKFYKKNSQICREGAEGRDLFILLDGSISVTSDNLFVTNISTPGEAFGEMSFFLNQKRTASLIANEDSHLFIVPFTQLENFTRKKCPDLYFKLAQGLSLRLAETLQRITRLENLQCKSKLDTKKTDLESLVNLEIDELKSQIIKYLKNTNDENVGQYLKSFMG